MLETVRHYADEKLRESGSGPDPRWRICRSMLDLAEQARLRCAATEQAAGFARLDAERDNLLAAHDAGAAEEDYPLAVKIARGDALLPGSTAASPARGCSSIRMRWSRGPRGGATRTGARLLFGAGQFAYFLGRLTEARAT